MIGAKGFDDGAAPPAVCSSKLASACNHGNTKQKKIFDNNKSSSHGNIKNIAEISEKKGCLLQQIQMAVGLQETYQTSLNHLLHTCITQNPDAITPAMHDIIVDRLRSLSRFYSHSSQTFFIAVSIMDRFLTIIKAKPHHLMCIGVASYYLAVKAIEKEKDVMSPEHLVRISQCGCSLSDLARMERIIISKLNWDVDAPSALTFLDLFHSWCVAESVMGTNETHLRNNLERLTCILEACLCNFHLTLFQPSVLAFTLLSIQLPRYVALHRTGDMDHLEWVLSGLEHFTKMPTNELQQCQIHLRDFLLDYCSSKCKRPTSKLVWVVSTRTAKNMRFSAQISSNLETIPENSLLLSSDDESLCDSSFDSDEIWGSDPPTTVNNPRPHPVMVVTAPSTKSAIYGDVNQMCKLPDVKLFQFHNQKDMAFCVL